MSMVDITAKPEVHREATAKGHIKLKPETIQRIKKGKIEKKIADQKSEKRAEPFSKKGSIGRKAMSLWMSRLSHRSLGLNIGSSILGSEYQSSS
jgi:hypothetical protein